METYYICSRKRGRYKVIARTNYLDGAKNIVKELRENYPKDKFFITKELEEDEQ